MVGGLAAGGVEVAVLHDDQDAVVAGKLAQRHAVALVVDAQDVLVKPHLAVAQRGAALLLEGDAVNLVLGHDVAACPLALDGEVGKVDVKLQHPQVLLGLEGYSQHLGLAVGVNGEPQHLRAWFASCHVIFLVARDACECKSLHVGGAASAVGVEHVVDGASVVALVHAHIHHVLSHIDLLGNLHNLVLTVLVEDDDVVDVAAVAHVLVLLECSANESLGAVDVEFLVGLGNLAGYDGVEVANGSAPWMQVTVFLLQVLIPVDGVLHQVRELVVDVGKALVEHGDVVVGFVAVELDNALHLDFHQAQDVVAGYGAVELWLEGLQALVDVSNGGVLVLGLLVATILIDALLDEDFLERGKE